MKIAAELNKRGDRFNSELDFVFANVVMAIIADTMLVWLPAPRASFATKTSSGYQSEFARWFKSCPDNAFQVRRKYHACACQHVLLFAGSKAKVVNALSQYCTDCHMPYVESCSSNAF